MARAAGRRVPGLRVGEGAGSAAEPEAVPAEPEAVPPTGSAVSEEQES